MQDKKLTKTRQKEENDKATPEFAVKNQKCESGFKTNPEFCFLAQTIMTTRNSRYTQVKNSKCQFETRNELNKYNANARDDLFENINLSMPYL